MPLADLLEALDKDAAQDLETTLAAQRQQAKQIVADANANAVTLVADAVAAATRDAQDCAATVRTQAQAQARVSIRTTIDAALAALRVDVEAALADRAATDGQGIVMALLRESLTELPTATRARVPATFVATVGDTWPDLEIVGDLDDFGVIVEDPQGRLLVNTVPVRLELLWPSLAAPLARGWEQA